MVTLAFDWLLTVLALRYDAPLLTVAHAPVLAHGEREEKLRTPSMAFFLS